ncbi:hypothetical protein P8C59_007822 [Phyllachora maydis]|uniref:Uncharacterized protein n=1 Tax=Phyllachora maydis TaxID=1825666 RepID=A0AAD9I9T6_9PEZI|nr:hypothetical protein P8C59_007822 [Phyllachora maydis]
MSSDALPIPPARFAAALADLPLASLHLKLLELRNSLAHLDHSNAQLRPFALGLETPLGGVGGAPDPDCAEAVRENEAVMARVQERIGLVRAEMERRGVAWAEFQTKEEAEAEAAAVVVAAATNGSDRPASDADAEERHPAWTDGTFTTGVLRNGQVHVGAVTGSGARNGAGGSLPDDELRRRMEEQLRGLGQDRDNDEGGMHL